jgi:hypothetical protein
MLQTSYWILGIGLTMTGVGLTLLYQGEALKRSRQNQDIGKRSYGAGLAWTVLGGLIVLTGFVVFLMVQAGIIQ